MPANPTPTPRTPRNYDPELGRYISADPIGQRGGINTYVYARDSPFVWLDPLGLDVIDPGVALSNPGVVETAREIDRRSPDNDILVTGGDRHRDDGGNIRSSTDNSRIPRSAPKSHHLDEQGARAIDFGIIGLGVSPSREFADDLRRDLCDYIAIYADGHLHCDQPVHQSGARSPHPPAR